MNVKIVSFNELEVEKIIQFTNVNIRNNYYSKDDIFSLKKMSIDSKGEVSFGLLDDLGNLIGLRITLLPGHLLTKINNKYLSINAWKVDSENVAYFKSLFIDKNFQKMGYGTKLTQLSIDKLKERDVGAVLAHSWIESPGNSSVNYLKAMGFEEVNSHKNFWSEIDYECIGCKSKPCMCTAMEMILYL